MKKNKNNIIRDWLSRNGDPEINRMVKHNLAIAIKVSQILKEREMSKKEFAQKMSKSPSEVSKWLTGTHNFTMKSIAKMEQALGVDLIYVEKEYKYVHLHIKKTLEKETAEYSFMSGYAS